MTDREKAIVMAYTGICMLEGEKLGVFYQYLEELYDRPVYTHEWVSLDIKEKSKPDFLQLCKEEQPEPCGDAISRQEAVKEAKELFDLGECHADEYSIVGMLNSLPSTQPERKRMSNKEWVDFLSEQFTVSRTSAKEMLRGLMKWKAEDNFKKQFSGGRNEKG